MAAGVVSDLHCLSDNNRMLRGGVVPAGRLAEIEIMQLSFETGLKQTLMGRAPGFFVENH